MSKAKFIIEDLHARIEDQPILKGVNLEIEVGQVHALMGPNGSGKSTLANVIMGHPAYEVTRGRILFKGENILEMETDERAKLGLFLAFQYPVEIPGVKVVKFLKRALEHKLEALEPGKKLSVTEFLKELKENMRYLGLEEQFINRYLNEGFSGGEKKRMEIVQMLTLKPEFAILDETDSGLDIDALKIVASGVQKLRGPKFGALVITHYQRILNYIKPDRIHVMFDGRVVLSGGPELSEQLEAQGYDWIKEKFGVEEVSAS